MKQSAKSGWETPCPSFFLLDTSIPVSILACFLVSRLKASLSRILSLPWLDISSYTIGFMSQLHRAVILLFSFFFS